MESRNVKIVDEHGIDREANIICSIDVDGSDYAFYNIERDNDNDNLFVSKLIKNVDGTSNMINIDDDVEKGKIADVIKGLVKYSIENEDNKLSSDKVTLNGKDYGIGSFIVNKEQYINVPKTYITTVKKSVTKVCNDYYGIDTSKNVDDNIFNDFPVFESNVEVKKEETVPEPVQDVVEEVKVEEKPLEVENKSVEEIPNVFDEASLEAPKVEEVKTDNIVEVPNLLEPVEEFVVAPEIPMVTAPIEEPVVKVEEPVTQNVESISEEVKVESEVAQKDVKESVVVPEIPVVTAPIEASVVKMEEVPAVEDTLVFDASKESNLTEVLGEISKDENIPVVDVEAVRDFGEVAPKEAIEQVDLEPSKGPVKTLSRGFASNKFVMAIAVMFFVASCVFLGYEVFLYFQIK